MAGLYIHVPFCASRCGYCDFFSTTQLAMRSQYVRALIAEMERQQPFIQDKPLQTIYFGGGTPSLLAPSDIERIMEAAMRLFNCSSLHEVTLEANPDDLTEDYLTSIASAGINRLSIGIQSFDERLLPTMNRRHTAAQAISVIEMAGAAGFDNISIDLIYGIPGMSAQQWRDTIRKAISTGVAHISAYALSIEPGTPFGRLTAQGKLTATGDADVATQYATLCKELAGAGYSHYEISNFALPGREAAHNSSYWKAEAYLGLGPGAHSYDGERVRMWCKSSLAGFLRAPLYEGEKLTDDELYEEYIMLSLRTAHGASPQEIASRFGACKLHRFETDAAPMVASGALAIVNGRYIIPEKNWLTADSIIRRLA